MHDSFWNSGNSTDRKQNELLRGPAAARADRRAASGQRRGPGRRRFLRAEGVVPHRGLALGLGLELGIRRPPTAAAAEAPFRPVMRWR